MHQNEVVATLINIPIVSSNKIMYIREMPGRFVGQYDFGKICISASMDLSNINIILV